MEDFLLKSFCLGAGEIDCKYRTTETENEVTTEQEYHVKVTRPVHNDLRNLFDDDLRNIVSAIMDLDEDTFGQMQAESISFAGKDENIGVVIKGVIHTKYGDLKYKTPRIKFLAWDAPVCADITVFVEKAIEEIKAYLFDGKTSEMQIFGE